MTPRVLLLNLHRTEAIESLLKDRTIDLSVITTEENTARYKGHRIHTVKDITNILEAEQAALSLSRPGLFQYVVTPLERGVLPAGMIRSSLGIPGITYDQALGFANKFIMKKRIQQAGIRVAQFRLLPHISTIIESGAEIGWPIVVKPTVGSGSQHTYRVRSERHARDLLSTDAGFAALGRRAIPMIAERELDVTNEFHCDGVVYDGKTIFCSISQYTHPLLDRIGTFVGSFFLDEKDPLSARIQDMHQQSIEILRLRAGVTHFEVFLTPDGLVFGEIACRPGGAGISPNVARKYGVDLWAAFLNLQLSRDPGITRPSSSASSRAAPIIAWVGLPARNGRLLEISTPGDFSEIPGVQNTTMLYHIGDDIRERHSVGAFCGYVFFTAATKPEVYDTITRISSRYYIRTMDMDNSGNAI